MIGDILGLVSGSHHGAARVEGSHHAREAIRSTRLPSAVPAPPPARDGADASGCAAVPQGSPHLVERACRDHLGRDSAGRVRCSVTSGCARLACGVHLFGSKRSRASVDCRLAERPHRSLNLASPGAGDHGSHNPSSLGRSVDGRARPADPRMPGSRRTTKRSFRPPSPPRVSARRRVSPASASPHRNQLVFA